MTLEDECVVIHNFYIQLHFNLKCHKTISSRIGNMILNSSWHSMMILILLPSCLGPTELHHGSTDPHVSQDRLWVARFNGGAVGCYDPRSGSLVAEVHVPKEAGRQVEPGRKIGTMEVEGSIFMGYLMCLTLEEFIFKGGWCSSVRTSW